MRAAFIDLTDTGSFLYIFEKKRGEWGQVLNLEFPSKIQDSRPDPLDSVDTVYLSLPLGMLNFRLIELPFSDKERVREVLPFQLEGLILEKEVVIDALVLEPDATHSSKGQNRPVLAVYTGKEMLRKTLADLKQLNVEPEIITSIDLKSAITRNPSAASIIEALFDGTVADREQRPGFALDEIRANTINLRKDEFAYTKKREEARKSLRITAVLYFVLVLVLLAYFSLNLISVRGKTADIRADIRKSYLGMFPGEKKITNEVYQTKARIKELLEKKERIAGISPLSNLLKISGVSGGGVVFTEITMDRSAIILKGEASSLSDVQKIRTGLEVPFRDVIISETKNVSALGILFTITAKERG